jgi:hypothetical protein
MSLAALAKKADGPRWQECTVHYALRTLPKPEADNLRAALDNDVVSHEDIAHELRRLYIRVQGGTVGRHRADKCECDACDCGCKG